MNTDNGALDFEVYFDNGKFNAAAEESKKKLQGFTNAAVDAGDKIDDAFKITAENVRIQKDVIAQLESELNKLKVNISKLPAGSNAQKQLQQEAAQVTAELKAEKDALKYLETQVESTEEAHVSYKAQLRMLRDELIQMEAAGKRNTKEYRDLQQRAGELKDAIGDAQQQMKNMADDEKIFKGIGSAITGITGAFTAVQGAVGMFAGENENLNRIMLKVQSMMAITIGLQQVAEMLNKDSYFSTIILTKAKEMFAVAELKVATAMGISTVAARALMATLTLGLSVAITAIIIAIEKFSSKAAEAKKSQEEFNKSVVENSYKAMVSVEELSRKWKSLGDDMSAKKKFIVDHAEAFDGLGVAINGVHQAEKLFSDPKNILAFKDAMMARAKSMAAAEMAAEKFKAVIAKEIELQAAPKEITKRRVSMSVNGAPAAYETYTVKNKERDKLTTERDKLNAEAKALFDLEDKFANEQKKIISDLGISSGKVVAGSIADFDNQISALQARYKKATTDSARAGIMAQLKQVQTLRDKIDKSDAKTDTFKEGLDKKKNLYDQYFKWVNSNDPELQKEAKNQFAKLLKDGDSYLEYLKNQRDKLLGSKSAISKKKLAEINNEIAAETDKTTLATFKDQLDKEITHAENVSKVLDLLKNKRAELTGDGSDLDKGKKSIVDDASKTALENAQNETKKLIEEYSSYLDKKKKLQKDYNEDMLLLDKQLREAKTVEEGDQILGAMSNRSDKYKKDSKSSGDSDYDALLTQYRTYQQKRQAITDDFEEKRKLATKMGDAKLVEQLNKEEAKAVSDVSSEELMNSPEWKELFGNLDNLAVSKIIELRDKIEAQWQELNLTPEQLNALRDKLNEAETQIQTRNPFKALSESVKAYSKDGNKVNFNNVIKSAQGSLNIVKSSINSVFSAFESLGGSVSDDTKKIIGDVMAIGDASIQVAEGIASGNPMQVIQGSIALISSGMSLMGLGAKELSEEVFARYEALMGVFDKLIDKQKEFISSLRGSDAVKAEEEAQILLQKQMDITRKMGKDYLNSGDGTFSASHGFKLYNTIKWYTDQISKKTGASFADMAKYTGKTFEDLGIDSSKFGERMTGLFNLSSEELAKIQKEMPEMWAALDEKTSGYLQTLIDGGEQAVELQRQINETLTQVSFDSTKDALKDLLLDADATMKDVSKKFEDYMRNAILSIIVDKTMKDQIAKWYDDFAKAMTDDTLTEDEKAKLQEAYKQIYEDAANMRDAAFDAAGLDATSSGNADAMKGAIKGVSEETADIISGQMNAMRINQIEQIQVIREQLIALNRIAVNTAFNSKLVLLDDILSVMKSMNSGDSLRSQGL